MDLKTIPNRRKRCYDGISHKVASRAYTPTGKISTTTDANGKSTQYAYDANGTVHSIECGSHQHYRRTGYGTRH
jgi:YD repeat-containing protein